MSAFLFVQDDPQDLFLDGRESSQFASKGNDSDSEQAFKKPEGDSTDLVVSVFYCVLNFC